jgi:predicted protein tyrosine phosphatase
MKLIVTDRRSIESGIVVHSPYVVVSIYTPGRPQPEIPRRCGLKAVSFTSFHDAEPVEDLSLPADIVLMTLDQAKAIWKFVKRHENEIGSIVCQCEQGISRSPAVAIALAGVYGSDVTEILSHSHPNQFVYGLMCQAIAESPKGEKRTRRHKVEAADRTSTSLPRQD